MSSKKTPGSAISMPIGIMWGTFVSLLTTCSCAALLSWLILNGKIDHHILGYLIMGVLISASILGAITAGNMTKRRRMLVCCITGISYFLSMLGITALFFGGNFQGAEVGGCLIITGSMIVGMVGVLRKRHQENSYERYRTR